MSIATSPRRTVAPEVATCERRLLIPFAELGGKDQLVRFMGEWRTRAKRL